MLASLGVLLILAGSSVFIIGLIRLLFPSANRFMPDGFKTLFSWRNGVYIILAGVVFTFLLGK